MAAKMKAAKKSAAKKPAAKKSPLPFAVGQVVKVKAGDYGNARGTVHSIDTNGAMVTLSTAVRLGPLPFALDNLVALPAGVHL